VSSNQLFSPIPHPLSPIPYPPSPIPYPLIPHPYSPKPALGCRHYHGQSYGQSRETRQRLICGFHPSGWNQGENCPDW
jgi:hypothetical protein